MLKNSTERVVFTDFRMSSIDEPGSGCVALSQTRACHDGMPRVQVPLSDAWRCGLRRELELM